MVYMSWVNAVGFMNLGLSVLFYFEHSYVAPIMTNYWFLNALIIPSLGFAMLINTGHATYFVSIAAIYMNSTPIWVGYLRSVNTGKFQAWIYYFCVISSTIH